MESLLESKKVDMLSKEKEWFELISSWMVDDQVLQIRHNKLSGKKRILWGGKLIHETPIRIIETSSQLGVWCGNREITIKFIDTFRGIRHEVWI